MLTFSPDTYPIKVPSQLSANAVKTLESELADYLGYKKVILLDTVDSAFSIALSTLDQESGLLCSPNAPIALFRAVKQHSLQAEYCDLRLDGTMETRFFAKTKTPQSKALLLSHNHGLLSDTVAALRFAREEGLTLIEDATQAFGKREKSGAQIALYSLETLVPSVIATGAFIATDDPALGTALRQRALGGYEQKKFWNYDLINTDPAHTIAPLTAQLAREAFKELDERTERVQQIRQLYLEKFSSSRLVELPDADRLAADPHFPVALVPALFCPKEDIYAALQEAGIPVKVGNKPIYKTAVFEDKTLSLFGAEEVFKAQLLLPSHHLMRIEDADSVAEKVMKVLEAYGYRGCSF